MNVLVVTKLYLDRNKAGGEAYLHHFLKRLQEKSKCNLEVLVPECDKIEKCQFEGITITRTTDNLDDDFLEYCNDADIVISHLEFAEDTVKYCLGIKKPVVMIFHNSSKVYDSFIENPEVIKIFNSNYVKQEYLYRELTPTNYYLLYPYTDFKKLSKYKKNRTNREYITLINPYENKGAVVVLQLAKDNPSRKFLIVKGGYAKVEQAPFLEEFKSLPNCHIIENTPNIINDIYLKTKIILQPSIYESYGMVSSEASCFGIPCIVNKESGGLVENLGKMCLGGYNNNAESYQKVIDALDVEENYHIWRHYYLDQAEERYHQIEYQLEDFFNSVFINTNN